MKLEQCPDCKGLGWLKNEDDPCENWDRCPRCSSPSHIAAIPAALELQRLMEELKDYHPMAQNVVLGAVCYRHLPAVLERLATLERERQEREQERELSEQAGVALTTASLRMIEALKKIKELTIRQSLPLTSEIHDIARRALDGSGGAGK